MELAMNVNFKWFTSRKLRCPRRANWFVFFWKTPFWTMHSTRNSFGLFSLIHLNVHRNIQFGFFLNRLICVKTIANHRSIHMRSTSLSVFTTHFDQNIWFSCGKKLTTKEITWNCWNWYKTNKRQSQQQIEMPASVCVYPKLNDKLNSRKIY